MRNRAALFGYFVKLYQSIVMNVFVDDSVHQIAGFVLCAVVFAPDSVTNEIARHLQDAGLVVGVDEFKSGARMSDRPELRDLRSALSVLVHHSCKIGVVVAPVDDRNRIGEIVLHGLAKMLETGVLPAEERTVFLDQGMFRTAEQAARLAQETPILRDQLICAEQDSREILGIQLADLVAHTCSAMLRAQLGGTEKTVKAGDNSGYDPDMDVELEFLLWASLRYAFISRPDTSRWKDEPVVDTTPGLYVDPACFVKLSAAALERFGAVWLGCIH